MGNKLKEWLKKKERILNIKQRVISLITEVDNGKYSNIALNEYFKENRLDKKERGFITEVFYGVIRNNRNWKKAEIKGDNFEYKAESDFINNRSW